MQSANPQTHNMRPARLRRFSTRKQADHKYRNMRSPFVKLYAPAGVNARHKTQHNLMRTFSVSRVPALAFLFHIYLH